eukprot:CAMPEP_0197436032 /NCGR_PEP_ID=MMETSP1175-20131217/3508_1 /TAXON_ID=1003142 /ORGANISM="Triceratium dubium, Strain CCMP147" /LENGTH=246 /DNA_ID=CAMNT_0042965209 /DNA_START=170 /DNA_END=910 /DNA_ORIENTATION=-
MKTVKAFRTRTSKSAETILSEGMKTVTEIDDVITKMFGMSPSEAEEAFKKDLETNGLDALNSHLSTSIPLVRTLLTKGCSHLTTLESNIALSVPQMEDGNNFGVTVQMTIAKFLKETKEGWAKSLEKLPGYYKERGEAVEKLGLSKTTASETKTETSTQSTGGKDGDANTTESKTVKSESTSNGAKVDAHRVGHLVAMDVQTYIELGAALVDLRDGYVCVLDNVEKNREKLENPKGSGGGNFGAMY